MYSSRLGQRKIRIIDSHTGGEPTRVVLQGGPDLGDGPLRQRLARFKEKFDSFRSAIVNEPRGSDAVVGALLCEPSDKSCAAGVIFFNNVGYLGMCGHGTIGLAVTLAHMGRIRVGRHRLETPIGIIEFKLQDANVASVDNVPSYRTLQEARVTVPGYGVITGDVAYGGNWFFLTNDSPVPLNLDNLETLTDYCWRIREQLVEQGITGDLGALIDHIAVYGPPSDPEAHSRNFVLCPGKSYDRSPCGTGTSAKLACLYADDRLHEGEVWRQESILGSIFEARYTVRDSRVYPTIRGAAYITSEATLFLDDRDPFCYGIR